MLAAGINEQNVGLTKLVGNVKLVFPPSYAAEAVIALAGKSELKSWLEAFLDLYSDGSIGGKFPVLSRWAEEGKGKIKWADLEERVRAHSDGMAHLVNSAPIKRIVRSKANVDYAVIRRRGDARKGGERSRSANVVLDEGGKVMDYNCTCPQFKMGFVRGNYDSKMFTTHVACYHINVALAEKGMLPYRFDDNFALLESLAMKIFRKNGKKAFLRDRFLFGGEIFSEDSAEGLNMGKLTVEVIWNRRNIKGRAKSILNGLKSYFETDSQNYRFAGFALDFQGTPYETTGIVLSRKDGRSVHLLYDDSLQVGRLPFFMLKMPRESWLGEGRQADLESLAGRNPVLYSAGRRYFEDFDQRTQKEMVAIILRPVETILKGEEKLQYARILSPAAIA